MSRNLKKAVKLTLFLSLLSSFFAGNITADSLPLENNLENIHPGFSFTSASIGLEGDVEVQGMLVLENGIRFRDGSVQSTAVTGDVSDYVIPVPAGEDALQNGARLLLALEEIDSSGAGVYLLKLDPGTYDLQSSSLEMKPGVHLEGAGERRTRIVSKGSATNTSATVATAAGTVLSRVTIENRGDEANAVAVLINGAPAALQQVSALAAGGGSLNYGVRILEADAVLDRVRATAAGGDVAYGISIKNVERVAIHHSSAGAEGALENNAFSVVNEFGSPKMAVHFNSVTGNAEGGLASHGLRWVGGAEIRFRNSSLTASGPGMNYGVRSAGIFTFPFLVENSTVTASGSLSYGLYISNSSASSPALLEVPLLVKVDHSRITGETHTLFENNGATFLVGATRLAGGPVATSLGSVTCVGSYDGDYQPLGQSCVRQ